MSAVGRTDDPGTGGADAFDRRRLLKGGVLVAAAALAAACGSPDHRASAPGTTRTGTPTGTGTTTRTGTTTETGTGPTTAPLGGPPPTGTPATRTPASEAEPATGGEWSALAESLTGSLVRPQSAGYRTDVELFDFRYDHVRPAGIVYCATPDDVARSLAFARDHGLTPTPRAGGHSYAGYSTSSGLVVDVTRMGRVTAPASGSPTATIGAGARLIDIYSGLNAAGVSIPGGSCPTVGLAGLALGGGIGVVGRLHGLTADRIASLQVVTADSRTVTASPTSNADLYWACRGGGGGNFGVVTSFEMTTFPTAPVALFTLIWPWAAARQVLPAWQRWMPAMPDELWSTCLLEAQTTRGTPLILVTGVFVGTRPDAASLLARLTAAAGAPASSEITPSAFSQAMYYEGGCAGLTQAACHLPTQVAGGTLTRRPSIAKSDMLTGPLGDAAVGIVVDAVDARQADGLPGAVAYDALGGVISRIAPAATAWSHRDAEFSVQYSVPLTAGAPGGTVTADGRWLSDMYAALRPYVSGQAYQNYIDPDLAGWAHAYYGANLARLEQVRRTWDPDGTFRFAQAIPIAG
jgi:FAD/FMN-containing dehydrogenase